MQTRLTAAVLDTREGREADAILRKCVHCGFCTATCPTYRLLGDELDGPRGRIYLIKEMLEGAGTSRKTQRHLDRCLTCRACETTCPSGVRYGRLLEIGRHRIEQEVSRPLRERLARRALLAIVPHRRRFDALIRLARLLRPLLPRALRRQVTPGGRPLSTLWPAARHGRRMLILEGCAQPVLAPDINLAAARLLDRLGVSLVRVEDGCCGALAQHLSAGNTALGQIRHNIDVWWPEIARGAQAILVTASGCGAMVRDYGRLLQDDPAYAAKAARVTELFRDLSEVIAQELASPDADLGWATERNAKRRIAFHSPCTLQHGLKIRGVVEPLLARAGFTLTAVTDGHICCGSAGSYSLLQPALAAQLRKDKLQALEADAPDVIATANIGCLMHLASGTERPVRHWIEELADGITG